MYKIASRRELTILQVMQWSALSKPALPRKRSVMSFHRKRDVQDVYTHDLKSLLRLAGLDEQLEKDMKGNVSLAVNWGVVKEWDEESRYVASGLKGKDMYTALTGPSGVLAWIKQRW